MKKNKQRVFIDTNIILRFLVLDHEVQYKKVERVFRKLESGSLSGYTTMLVIAEVIWTLLSFCKESKRQVIVYIQSLLTLEYMEIEQRDILIHALEIFERSKANFIDCYNYACALDKHISTIATFDSDWDRFDHVTRMKL